MEYSDVIIEQTKSAWKFLEDARPLITYIKLVPVSDEQITHYEHTYNKVVPPDYRYWLTTYGSGRIEFLDGALEIPSIYELTDINDHHTMFCEDEPKDWFKRIYFDVSAAPVFYALDSTIIDEHGCAPFIMTSPYSFKVGNVIASSWPMYVVRRVIEIIRSLKSNKYCDNISPDQVDSINNIGNQIMNILDFELANALTRAGDHNKTKSGSVDNIIKNSLDQDCLDELTVEDIANSNNTYTFNKILNDIERFIDQGYSSLWRWINPVATIEDEEKVKTLLGHDRREVREIAEKCWQQINFKGIQN